MSLPHSRTSGPLAAARMSVAALALAGLVLAGCGPGANAQQGQQGPASVGVVVAATEPVTLSTELTGRTSAVLVSEVRPQVGGIVKARLFQEGGFVRAGQVLYQIDPATYQAAYDSARAGQAQAEATLEAARLKAERYGKLAETGAVSKQDNDEAQAAYKQAQANVAAQKAAVQTARINLGFTRVTAPISGRIGKSAVTPGALVTASQGEALATIQRTDRIYVDVSQSSAEILRLRSSIASGGLSQAGSAEVTLILEDGTEYPIKGRLQFSDVTVDPGTGQVGLRAVFENPDGVLLPGMFVRARLNTATASQGILVPQIAVSRDPTGGASVMVVGAGEKVEARKVVVGQSVGDKWLVTSGLKPGDRVVVEGLQGARPGTQVKAQVIAPGKARAQAAQAPTQH
ncbi:MAG: efflux RND transporter periplasmic adaptor subunit [Caulobacter sp.]